VAERRRIAAAAKRPVGSTTLAEPTGPIDRDAQRLTVMLRG